VIETPLPPAAVLERYALDPRTVTPIVGGLINRSFGVSGRDGDDFVLQRVNPMFAPEIHDDIDAVTRHLKSKGLTTPLLVATLDGKRFVEADGALWRLLTRVPGSTREALTTAPEAREAGRVLGAFHRALADFAKPLRNQRPPVHVLERHLANLDGALGKHVGHRRHPAVTGIAARIGEFASALPPLGALPSRLLHGDPKISNIVFRDADAGKTRASGDPPPVAVCLVDLDTLTRMAAPLEIGDALRSWCNTSAEDSPEARFSVERFGAAIEGYRLGAGDLLTEAEWRAVPAATLCIAIELAARFAADALNESYFAWDNRRYASAGEHNQARAEAQLRLAASISAALPELRQGVMTEA
jgi:Ser/Thr protein kinase RdoA (MazF antagonist)